MKKWLTWWLMFLTLGIAGDGKDGNGSDAGEGDAGAGDTSDADAADVDADADVDAADADAGEAETDAAGDADADTGGDEPQPKAGRRESAVIAARKRAQDAEAEAERLRAENATLRPKPKSQDDALFEQEETKLRDPKTTPLEKWQIESNRTIRATRQQSQSALAQAQDLADRTAFDLAASKNKRLAAVKDDVEKHLQRMRATGQNAAREGIAYYLLGQKVANAPAKKAPPPVERGRTPGAKSDVRARGGQSEREKRAARLENQPI